MAKMQIQVFQCVSYTLDICEFCLHSSDKNRGDHMGCRAPGFVHYNKSCINSDQREFDFYIFAHESICPGLE